VIRLSVLLALLVMGRAEAEPAEPLAGALLDADRLVSVYAEALTFIAPRVLDPIPVPLLTVWGLRSLTSLDPAIIFGQVDGRLLVSRQGQVVRDFIVPTDATPAAWAQTAALISEAGYAASPSIRQAGTQGIIQAFFNEMFSHIDPYSRYVPPAEAGEDRARRGGRAGVGITVGQQGRMIAVSTVVRDSPAAIAGIKPGDFLLAIDGQRTQDQDQATIAALMAGAEGSLVSVTWRGRDGRTRDAQLTRELVPPETVFAERLAGVLVLRVTGFSGTTASHIALSVQDALATRRPIDGIVIDLRDNRGGLLRQAVTAADTFLPAGLVVSTIGRDPDANHIWRSAEGELAENVPLIVLVDGRTASAAEILAGALADRGRAVVVGSSTAGKGLVQTIDPLPDGGELFVTWSRVLMPLGWPLQGMGLLPQVCTSLGRADLDRQLASLSAGLEPLAAAIKAQRAARAPLSPEAVLTFRAPCPAAEGRPADLDAARALIANPAAYGAALLPPMIDREIR
jgi:carboxyl-terminal processing protease